MAAIRKIRTRIYLAVEGEGEQSFVRLLQEFANQNNLYIHLDCKVLGGGGYESMLKQAIQCWKRDKKQKSTAKISILLIDGDRAERCDDGWTLIQLKNEAAKIGFQVCVQHPNQEGLLFRLLPGNENKKPSLVNINKLLVKQWPNYRKPVDFRMLSQRFNLDDLLRLAQVDADLDQLLSLIGLK